MVGRLMMEIADKRSVVSQLLLAISLVVLVASASADTTSYEFVPGESEFVLMGGIASLDETYTVEGSLGLGSCSVVVRSAVDSDVKK